MSNPKPKIAKSETRLAETGTRDNILEELPIGICRLNLKGSVEYINEYFEKVTGYTRDEIIGRNALKLGLFPDDMKNYILKRITARIGGAPSKKWDTQFKCKDGTWIWVTLEGMIIWKLGVPVGFQIAASDITERKQMEEALRALSTRQQAILTSVPDIIMEVDKDKVYTWTNSAGLKFFGEDVIGKEASFYFEGEQNTYDQVQPLLDGDENFIYVESWQRRKDGEKRLLAWWCRVLKDVGGNVTGALSTARDITERKQTEEALRESEAKYRLMVESSRDAIVISQNDIFIFINDAFASMLDYQKEELLMCSYKTVYTEKAIKILEERDKQRSNGEAVADRYETVFKKKDGTEVNVEANIRVIDYKGQKATFAVIRDITKQKEVLAALQISAGQSKGLKNFNPICAGCNKIRDDEQESLPWLSPAVYINDRLPDINFSHGMCPDCMKKWYPEYDIEKMSIQTEIPAEDAQK